MPQNVEKANETRKAGRSLAAPWRALGRLADDAHVVFSASVCSLEWHWGDWEWSRLKNKQSENWGVARGGTRVSEVLGKG